MRLRADGVPLQAALRFSDLARRNALLQIAISRAIQTTFPAARESQKIY